LFDEIQTKIPCGFGCWDGQPSFEGASRLPVRAKITGAWIKPYAEKRGAVIDTFFKKGKETFHHDSFLPWRPGRGDLKMLSVSVPQWFDFLCLT
jgi:hypothetical protein